MMMVFLILAVCLMAGFFLVGQYNAQVTVRHRIATVVLEIDFLLQQQAADLEVNPRVALEGRFLEELQKARAASHRIASNPQEPGALESLSDTRKVISRISEESGCIGTKESQKRQLDQASLKLEGLVAHYSGMLGKNPAFWIARRLLDA